MTAHDPAWYSTILETPLPEFEGPAPNCIGVDPEIFFARNRYEEQPPTENRDLYRGGERGKALNPLKVAKELCMDCFHIEPCRDFAIRNNLRYGIWGGTTERERRVLRKLMFGEA